MAKVRYTDRDCKWCHVTFASFRDDVRFCCGAHKAAYDRAYGSGAGYNGHADKPLEHAHVCEECGKAFEVNDYAERGGERKARFCSSRCRVKFWRKNNPAANTHPHDQAKQGAERKGTYQKTQNKGTSQGSAAGSAGAKRTSSEDVKRTSSSQPKGAYSDDGSVPPPMWDTGRRGMSSLAARKILGVGEGCTWETVRKHYKAAATKYHPDTNKLPFAKEWMQRANAAYEVLCKIYGK